MQQGADGQQRGGPRAGGERCEHRRAGSRPPDPSRLRASCRAALRTARQERYGSWAAALLPVGMGEGVGAQVGCRPAGRVGAPGAADGRGARRVVQYGFEVRTVLRAEAGRFGPMVSRSLLMRPPGRRHAADPAGPVRR
ncbi:hypothetical protein [Streptomyces sp. NPDC092370]|uniref:hypothetical protein n=1 Tax=Streptomyces sp. NPDC092370 TaxID=3366016 RepID=UPI00382F9C47